MVGGLEIAGTGELPALNRQMHADRSESPEEWGRLIVGGEAPVGEGDLWLLNSDIMTDGEHAVVDGWHEMGPDCWQKAVAAPSFEAWLRRAFDAAVATGEPYYWPNSPEVMRAYRACIEEAEARRGRAEGPRPVIPMPPGGFPTASVSVEQHASLRRGDAASPDAKRQDE